LSFLKEHKKRKQFFSSGSKPRISINETKWVLQECGKAGETWTNGASAYTEIYLGTIMNPCNGGEKKTGKKVADKVHSGGRRLSPPHQRVKHIGIKKSVNA